MNVIIGDGANSIRVSQDPVTLVFEVRIPNNVAARIVAENVHTPSGVKDLKFSVTGIVTRELELRKIKNAQLESLHGIKNSMEFGPKYPYGR